MKVLIVHNVYQQHGGEDVVVRNEIALLREQGHDVREFIVSNRRIGGTIGVIRVGFGTVFSLRSYLKTRRLLKEFAADVVHVHNFFPLVSPSVFYACHHAGVASVMTLHNYRILCPTSLLMYDGAVTEKSLHDGPWWAVPKRVYRDSTLGTLVLAAMISIHKVAGTWSSRVTRFIALTQFAAHKFTEGGIPAFRISVKPNFVDISAPPDAERLGLLFVGRLSVEKGVSVLADAISLLGPEHKIMVAGEGPQAAVLAGLPGVQMLGALDAGSVARRMVRASALVMPSLWYEGFPMVLVEAYASGLPIIASRIGALAELVEDGSTGLLFDPGSARDLSDKMRWALEHPEEMARMGREARARYEARYTRAENYGELMAIYDGAIAANDKGRTKHAR